MKRETMELVIDALRDLKIHPDQEDETRFLMAKIEAIEYLEQQLNNGWIPVSEKLPEENIDNITNDFLEYNVSLKFEYAECTRTYKFGAGKWWNNGTDMTEYVIAWRPLPEPYNSATDINVATKTIEDIEEIFNRR